MGGGVRLSLSRQPNPTLLLLLVDSDLGDLIGGLTIVGRTGAASSLHLGQQTFHGSPMVELVLNRCFLVESRSHGQGHLNSLTRHSTEGAIAVHTLDSVARPPLVAFALPVLSELANIGLLLASGIGVAVADVLAVALLRRAVLLVGPCLASTSLFRIRSSD